MDTAPPVPQVNVDCGRVPIGSGPGVCGGVYHGLEQPSINICVSGLTPYPSRPRVEGGLPHGLELVGIGECVDAVVPIGSRPRVSGELPNRPAQSDIRQAQLEKFTYCTVESIDRTTGCME